MPAKPCKIVTSSLSITCEELFLEKSLTKGINQVILWTLFCHVLFRKAEEGHFSSGLKHRHGWRPQKASEHIITPLQRNIMHIPLSKKIQAVALCIAMVVVSARSQLTATETYLAGMARYETTPPQTESRCEIFPLFRILS